MEISVHNGKPNYDSVSVALAEQELRKAGIKPNIMIDCSHANSNKDPALQPLVLENVTNQILEGNRSIIGLMVESNIGWGAQKVPEDLSQLQYGVSSPTPASTGTPPSAPSRR